MGLEAGPRVAGRLSKFRWVDRRDGLWMLCQLSPAADMPWHRSWAEMGQQEKSILYRGTLNNYCAVRSQASARVGLSARLRDTSATAEIRVRLGGTHAQSCSEGNIGERRFRDRIRAVHSGRRNDGQQSGQCRHNGDQFRAA
jgi:hypothetical protein